MMLAAEHGYDDIVRMLLMSSDLSIKNNVSDDN